MSCSGDSVLESPEISWIRPKKTNPAALCTCSHGADTHDPCLFWCLGYLRQCNARSPTGWLWGSGSEVHEGPKQMPKQVSAEWREASLVDGSSQSRSISTSTSSKSITPGSLIFRVAGSGDCILIASAWLACCSSAALVWRRDWVRVRDWLSAMASFIFIWGRTRQKKTNISPSCKLHLTQASPSEIPVCLVWPANEIWNSYCSWSGQKSAQPAMQASLVWTWRGKPCPADICAELARHQQLLRVNVN